MLHSYYDDSIESYDFFDWFWLYGNEFLLDRRFPSKAEVLLFDDAFSSFFSYSIPHIEYSKMLRLRTLITSPNRLKTISEVYFFLVWISSMLISIRLYRPSGMSIVFVILVPMFITSTFS